MSPELITLSKMEDGRVLDDSFGEKIVISGMSGLFPQCHNVKDLSNILYNKINPVNNENQNWQYDHPEVSSYSGKVPGLKQFDGQFFKVHYRLGANMDSMSRKVLEHTFQAIYDAGISVSDLSGRRVGVYTGSSFAETEKIYACSARMITGQSMAGCSKSMFANRISYWLNVTGPSVNIDGACCSSMGALALAYQSIKQGVCEAAIVTGSHICLHPQSSIQFGRLIKISTDGKTRSFDAEAEGCAKSEAINVLFLQKAKNALRIYAEVVHVKCDFISMLQDELGQKYGFYRDPETLANFIRNFYKEAKVSPKAVEYVEAFGSATPEADKVELEVIDEVFCVNNNKQLLVGSVMSNIGYTEAASGISALTKVLLGYHHGQLAGNLHCESPRKDVAGLRDGRIRILTDHQSFGQTYTAVNGLSVTGINAHVLLKGWYKRKDITRYKSNIPRLVTISGRQESAVNFILQDLKSRPIDAEELALFYNIHETRISGHLGRGFIILDTNEKNETVSLSEKISYFNDATRPLWFVYSGMGSQWAGMGAQLMRIPIFAAAIERCRKVLEPKAIDVVQIITSPDKNIFDNILNSFVGIAAIQIGLTDVLSAMKIFPDKIIGHSVGELGCAYADGCLTAEEMILSAYSRGLVSVQTPFIRGSMAAVGIGYKQISKMCPPEIEVACHNGPDSSTISGPADIMKEFVAQLTAKNIFAKEVACSNIAYHSRYIADAGPGLLQHLGEIIKTPKMRSNRWISTSVPKDRWNEPIAKYSSAEYHTNNLLNSVLFEEASYLIPPNAVLVEIAPHGLLQAILKRSLPDSCKHIPLTKRNHHDNALFLLQAIGNLYIKGFNPNAKSLYPKVEFPVSSGTPMLSHLIQWAHEEKWNLPLYIKANRKSARCRHTISVHDDDHSYLKGHVIQGRNTYPFAAMLVAVWDTLAMALGVPKKNLSVRFRDAHLHSQPVLHGQKPLRLSIDIHKGNGRFEVLDEDINIASGFITRLIKQESPEKEVYIKDIMEFQSEDIYKLLECSGYNYENDFRSIHEANLSLTKANLVWQNNWATLIDGMLQIHALRDTNQSYSQLRYIENLEIDVEKHLANNPLEKGMSVLIPATISRTKNNVKCGGIYIEKIKRSGFSSIKRNEIALKTITFVPYVTSNTIDETSALYVLLQVVTQNLNRDEINILELIDDKNVCHFHKIREIISDIPEVEINFTQVQRNEFIGEKKDFMRNVDLLMTNDLENDDGICQLLHRVVKRNTFVINKAHSDLSDVHPSLLCRKVCTHSFGSLRLDLLVWLIADAPICNSTSAITFFSQDDLNKLLMQLPTFPAGHKITIITSYPAFTGLKDLIKEKRFKDNRKINLVIVNHKLDDKQDLNPLQFPDLTINILNNGIWGGEYYLPVKENIISGQQTPLELTRSGDIALVRWIPITPVNNPGVPIKVQYVGLNDAYVKQVSGLAASENNNKTLIVFSFSGITDRSIRVMGIAQEESIRTHVKAKPELLWPVPEHWTLEDAATVPLAYSLAFYCLCFKSKLNHGNSILVHAGAGALGQALISIALAHRCEIYTTVSSYKKKRFLLKLFPELKDDHIGNSRDGSFVNMVLSGTSGRGCDIVITCVKQNLRSDSLKCCALFGFIVDTALVMESGDYSLEMYYLCGDVTFTNQQFSSLFEPQHASELKKLQLMMSEGIARRFVRPLSRVVFAPADTGRALHLQASSRHFGRVLINMQEEISATQIKINCSSDGLQMVLTDNEVLGVKLVERLIRRGAKKIHLQFNSSKSQSIWFKLRTWEQYGIQCTVSYGSTWNEIYNNLINNSTQYNLEGIYCIVTSNADCDFSKCLEYLKSIARRSNFNIRYFTVIDASKDVSDVIKLNQSQDNFITIKVSPLEKIESGEFKEYFTKDDAVDAIERALCSKHRVLAAFSRNKFYKNLLEEIAAVAGLPNPTAMSQDIKLKDLVMDVSKLQAVQIYMQDEYNISLNLSTVQLLTTKKIRDIQEKIIHKDFTEIDCLRTFFSRVEQDELLATTEMVCLPTLTTCSAKRDDEFDLSNSFLCIIPGVEGLHLRFHTLCERLKLPAMVLQPGFERPNETIQELAQRCAQILLKKAKLKTQFYLLGYESGVLVSLEIAAILEEHGLTGTIFCIGGGPDEIQAAFEQELANFQTEHSLKNAVSRHMLSLLCEHSVNTNNLEDDLNEHCTWKQKVSVCVQKFPGNIGHTIQYAEQVIEAAYERIVQVRRYSSKLGVLRSQIISMRPSTVSNKLKLSLHNHSQLEVIEYELGAPLANTAQDLRCTAIINRHLGMDILADFENKNLCESYPLNNDSVIQWDDTVE